MENATWEQVKEYVLNNVEYTYNVGLCLEDFRKSMQESGMNCDIFYMTKDSEHFEIAEHLEIKDDEEFIHTYDVRLL